MVTKKIGGGVAIFGGGWSYKKCLGMTGKKNDKKVTKKNCRLH